MNAQRNPATTPTVQEVSGALRACNLHAAKRTRREHRSGFRVLDPRVRGVRSRGIVVMSDDTDDPMECSDIYETCLTDHGFEVSRPFPDNTVLLVRRTDNPAAFTRPAKLVMKLEPSDADLPTTQISSDKDAATIFREMIGDDAYEHFVVLFLNVRNRVIGYTDYTEGSQSGVTVQTSSIVRDALAVGAIGIITAHQHPSGISDASDEDERLWDRLRRQASAMDIQLLDNLVLGVDSYYSERLEGISRW